MNPLEALKQKLKVKPIVQEKEKVAVIIKGDKQNNIGPKKNKEPREKTNKEELEEFIPEVEEEEKEKDIVKEPVTAIRGPLIIDQTDKGYDRITLLQKLKESKMTKVSVKPLIEKVEEKKIVEPVIEPPKKRAKKVKLPLIIEEDIDEKEVKGIEDKENEGVEGEEKQVEDEKEQPEIIQAIVPQKRVRKTKKVVKGTAIL